MWTGLNLAPLQQPMVSIRRWPTSRQASAQPKSQHSSRMPFRARDGQIYEIATTRSCGLRPNGRPSGHSCATRRVVVPSAVLVREIAPHDSAPIRRPLPWSSQDPASATSEPFDVGRVTGRPLDEDTQYRIRRFSARSSNQKHKSRQNIILDIF